MYLCTFLYFQLKVCMWFLAGLTSIQMIAALSFKPLMPSRDESEPKKDCLHQLINVDNWKNTKYVIWALAIPSALFGYFVPYVHIVSHFQNVMACPFIGLKRLWTGSIFFGLVQIIFDTSQLLE